MSQNVVLLLHNLVDHHSDKIQIYLESDREGLITRLVHALRIQLPPRRPKDEEVQTTSLIRAFLEMSGGRVDREQHEFFDESTTDTNAELFTSVLEITRTKEFGNPDMQEMIALITRSPLFSKSMTNVQDLDDRTMEIGHSLLLGYEEGHLVEYPTIVNRPMLTRLESSTAGVNRIQLWSGTRVPPLLVGDCQY